MNRKSVFTLARVMMGIGLLMFADGIASASSETNSTVALADAPADQNQSALGRADRNADENQSRQDTESSRYCSKAATGTDPDENEDLKPMAVQIRDALRRQYCGQ